MLGVYDFCGHYEWTFAWLEKEGGPSLLHEYWDKAIHQDSQRHAAELIARNGIEGMKEYWGHALSQEGAGYTTSATEKVFRLDIHDCPSKGFLIRNGLEQHSDYCDHCVGWIGPMLKQAGFAIDHQHNHCGQCWWEMRSKADNSPPTAPGKISGPNDILHDPRWNPAAQCVDTFFRANGVEQKVDGPHVRKAKRSSERAWETVASLPQGIGNAVCGVFGNDVIVAGGITWNNGSKVWLREVLVLDAHKEAWIRKEPLPEPIAYCAFCQTEGGLHFAGGGNGTSTLTGIFQLDKTFELRQTGALPQALALSGAAETGGVLYIVGGVTDIANPTSSDVFYALNLADGRVERFPSFPGGRILVPAAAALNGKVFVFGGAQPAPASNQMVNLDNAFVYSVTEKEWSRLTPLPFLVRGAGACALDDRHILIAGGFSDWFSADCFIYDTHTDRYSKSLPLPHATMASFVRAGEYVYCIGGEDRMKYRSPNCYRIEWRKLLERGS